ncbi:dehydrogenase [Streptomyces spiroverticillatus]|uniref:Dehydrogenase n=1 Tax=Streptomyces finlayi TaxID=67296 RepID=A0A918WTZ1_9ACTN|nr:NAD(P)-binding domain-containing protein [Streptomyces finlayi]GGZ90220.1 dehydrogenase [Streptomyces spiroverticillatus]GHC81073.1 dehydrogenase [Streptomyces finlayi]
MPEPTPVTFLGLGNMGHALASTALAAGHPITVWNRTPSRTTGLAEQGATPAPTPAEAVAATDLTLVCLLTDETVAEVLAPVAESGALKGKTLVNVTNSTPEQARQRASWAQAQGATYLDGGIMAIPQLIGTPHSYIYYSGDEQAFTTHRPLLARFGDPRYVGTDPGLASLYDMALLTGMYGLFTGAAQALALIRSAGLPTTDFAEQLQQFLIGMTAAPAAWGKSLDADTHATAVSTIAVNHAALPNLLATHRDQGLPVDLLTGLQPLLDRAIAEGHATDGLSRLAELLTR